MTSDVLAVVESVRRELESRNARLRVTVGSVCAARDVTTSAVWMERHDDPLGCFVCANPACVPAEVDPTPADYVYYAERLR